MIRRKREIFAAITLTLAAGGAFGQAAPSVETPAAASASAGVRAGFVKSAQGNVRLVGPSGKVRPLKVGDAVASADRIETDADSCAALTLRDGTVLVIGASSHLDLKQFDFDATTQEGGLFVSLVRGSLRMITGLLGKKPESVRVDTQTATMGIRGTDFIVMSGDRM